MMDFAEKMRRLMVWMLFGAGVVCTAIAVGALLILTIIGWGLLGALGSMGAVIASLAIGGPVGRFKGTLPGGSGFDLEAKPDTPPATTVTTTMTTGDKS
jgi:fumarate reductase subunit D